MAIRAFLLDVGNTLVHERPSRFEIYAESARQHGLRIDAERMHALMRQVHAELPPVVEGAFRYTDGWFDAYIARIFHHHLGLAREELPELSRALFARFSDPATFALYPGALELLEGLRARGLRVGIVSNWSARLPGLLERLEVARRVDFVLCSALERAEKPDPALFARALELARARPEEAVHAGDDLEKDVLGARRAGLRSILVDHAGTRAGLSVPRVTSLAELLDLAGRLAA
jgi:putative hydrolase of the HAD superfamily